MGCCSSSANEERTLIDQDSGKPNIANLPKEENKPPAKDIEHQYENVPPPTNLAQKKRAIALWDFGGDETNEQIAFKAGDEIIVLEEDEESGWWWGVLDGKEGYFPVNYTEIKNPEAKTNPAKGDPKNKPIAPPNHT